MTGTTEVGRWVGGPPMAVLICLGLVAYVALTVRAILRWSVLRSEPRQRPLLLLSLNAGFDVDASRRAVSLRRSTTGPEPWGRTDWFGAAGPATVTLLMTSVDLTVLPSSDRSDRHDVGLEPLNSDAFDYARLDLAGAEMDSATSAGLAFFADAEALGSSQTFFGGANAAHADALFM